MSGRCRPTPPRSRTGRSRAAASPGVDSGPPSLAASELVIAVHAARERVEAAVGDRGGIGGEGGARGARRRGPAAAPRPGPRPLFAPLPPPPPPPPPAREEAG